MTLFKLVFFYLPDKFVQFRPLSVILMILFSVSFLSMNILSKALVLILVSMGAWISLTYHFSFLRWVRVANVLWIFCAITYLSGDLLLTMRIFILSFILLIIGLLFGRNSSQPKGFLASFVSDLQQIHKLKITSDDYEAGRLILDKFILALYLFNIFIFSQVAIFALSKMYLYELPVFHFSIFLLFIVAPILIVLSSYFVKKKQLLLVVLLGLSVYLHLHFNFIRNELSDLAYITEISADHGSNWSEITVNGKNFKSLPFSGSVTLNGEDKRVLLWSDEQVVFEIEPGKPREGVVQVILDDGRVSNIQQFFE